VLFFVTFLKEHTKVGICKENEKPEHFKGLKQMCYNLAQKFALAFVIVNM
jgi:hypothetical protein